MHNAMNAVLEFHEATGLHIGDPRNPDTTIKTQFHWDLIHEELQELTLALMGKDESGRSLSKEEQIVAAADALGDIAYTTCGAAVAWGIDLGPVFDAIHASNMSKIIGGVIKREDGKVLKGPNYRPPDIAGALALTKAEAEETGFGQDCFWPTPTVLHNLPPKIIETPELLASREYWKKTLEEPPPVSRELKLAAAMKSIKDDFVPDLGGYFTSYGSYVFDCSKCGRTHTADTKQGSRNGWASKAVSECMCGMRYELVFVQQKGKDPIVQTIAIDLGGVAPSGRA